VAHGSISEVVPASCQAAFDLIHDYDRRLEWDTLLRAAYLDDGFTRAEKGATSVCIGRRGVAGMRMKTVYVSFECPTVAAVRLVEPCALFERWAASIRHGELEAGTSRVTYTFEFTARPRVLRWLFEPILLPILRRETRRRLAALRDFLARAPLTS
jgi:hypothetical protein